MTQAKRARRTTAAGPRDRASTEGDLQRWRLANEAQELVGLYRHLAARTPSSPELPTAAFAIGRAIGDLDQQWTRATLEHAACELASARETLTRLRRNLTH